MEDRLDRDTRYIVWVVSSIMSFAAAMVIYLMGWVLFFTSVKVEEGLQHYQYIAEQKGTETTAHLNEPWLNSQWTWMWIVLFAGILVFIITLILSVMKTGRKEPGGVHLNWFDRIWSDVQIAAGISASALLVPSGMLMYNWLGNSSLMAHFVKKASEGTMTAKYALGYIWYEEDNSAMAAPFEEIMMEPAWVEIFVGVALAVLVFAFELCIIQSVARKLKSRCFWRRTFIGTLACWTVGIINRESSHLTAKILGLAILAALLCATWIGTVVIIVLLCIFVPKWIRQYQDIRDGVERARNGNFQEKIQVEGEGELPRLAEGINAITEAQSLAVQNELRTQRLKTDLISNVSHDLKTPLTSMVSYVDLLKEEGLDGEHAPEYLEIIDEKTNRLQKLTEDLFEAAKASSGDIPVNLERIEMGSIVNQALAELDENLEKNQIQVIFNRKAEDDHVMADGRLLWRVIENLMTNISKYALPGSRAYVDILDAPTLGTEHKKIRLEVKNISKDPLNIDADELMERFKRGDQARNTEGSGLGLAIARDLTNLMGGHFDIVIDGDLFKAVVDLNQA